MDPWVRKIPWRRNGNPLQYSCLGNLMEIGGWWATVHGVAKSWTLLVTRQQQQPPSATPPYTHTHTHTLMLTFFLIPSPHIITHSCLLSLFPSCYFFSFYISDVQNLHLTGTWGNDYVLGNTPTKEIKVIIST